MTSIKFNEEDAGVMAWVISGADRTDHGSVIIFEVQGSNVTVSTNSPTPRSVTVAAENVTGDGTFAARSRSFLPFFKKVKEESVTILIEDSVIHVSRGGKSAHLTDIYPGLMDLRLPEKGTQVARLEPGWVLGSLTDSSSAILGDEIISVKVEDNEVMLDSGSDSIRTMEQISEMSPTNSDPVTFGLYAKDTTFIKPLLKSIDLFESLNVYVIKGGVRLVLDADGDAASDVKSVSMGVPCLVNSGAIPGDTPCAEDVKPVANIPRTEFTDELKTVSGIGSKDSLVKFDTTNPGRIVLSVDDPDGSTKSVIIGATVIAFEEFSIPVGIILSAIKSIHNSDLSIGFVDFKGDRWITLEGMFDPESENSEQGSITIAMKAV